MGKNDRKENERHRKESKEKVNKDKGYGKVRKP
jgi:hypothetical protein